MKDLGMDLMGRGARTLFSGALALLIILVGMVSNSAGQDRYCGVYSVYSILDQHGRNVSFESLLKSGLVSSYEGSTAADLAAALREHGVAVEWCSGLGPSDLRVADRPIVLHVRGSQATREYKHWVTYLGEEQGKARILDSSRGEKLVSHPDLLAMWDGAGIVTAESKVQLYLWKLASLSQRFLLLIILGAMIRPILWALHSDRLGARLPSKWWKPCVTGAVFLAAVFVLAVGFDYLSPNGLIRNKVAMASVSSVHFDQPIESIELADAVRLHAQRQSSNPIVWIDARYRFDYEHGHIPDAISIPVDAEFSEEESALKGISPQSQVVIYCQSRGCGFAKAVAQRVRARGFSNIALFAPGYAVWEEEGNKVEPPPSKPNSTPTN